MIVAVWHRWRSTGRAWWILVLALIVTLDAVVGSWLIAWELGVLRDAW